MVKRKTQLKKIKRYSVLLIGSLVGLLTTTPSNKVEGAGLGGPTHIGTFEGSTTFMTTSSNGINSGLFLEVMDEYGNLTQYESEDGIITVPNTKEGAYVTQAKFLGKTKYRDQDTGELLDVWEEGRNLELLSVENPELKTVGKNLFDKNTAINGYFNIDTGILTSGDINWKYQYIEVKPNTTYTISGVSSIHTSIGACQFDKNKNLINTAKAYTNGSFTTDTRTEYIGGIGSYTRNRCFPNRRRLNCNNLRIISIEHLNSRRGCHVARNW